MMNGDENRRSGKGDRMERRYKNGEDQRQVLGGEDGEDEDTGRVYTHQGRPIRPCIHACLTGFVG